MESGASGFVLKDAPVEALAAAIRRCAAGEDVVDASLATQALRAGIALRHWLSEGTVRNNVSEILGKVGAHNRTEAAQIARENGWL